MKVSEMKKICKPLGITVDCRWADGFLVCLEGEAEANNLRSLGFTVESIGIGYDYNAKRHTLYANKVKA